jgi:apolipoprotein N-acyltransferase
LTFLLAALKGKSWRRALFCALLFGVTFHGAANYWLVPTVAHLSPFTGLSPTAMLGWGILAFFGALLWQTLFVVLFGMLAWALLRRPCSGWQAVALGGAWLLSEWLRSLGTLGYPWALLASTQVAFLPLLQLAAWVGSYGLGALLVTVNALLAMAWWQRRWAWALWAMGLLVTAIAFGWWDGWQMQKQIRQAPHLTVAVVQGNFGMSRWRPDADENRRRTILREHLRLSELAARRGAKVIVWSETALPWALRVDGRWQWGYSALQDFVRRRQVVLLVGAGEWRRGRSYNACFVFAPTQGGAEFVGVYRKARLVPFGEYTPWREQLPWLARWLPQRPDETSPGDLLTAVPISFPRRFAAAIAICFESLFPFHVRQLLYSPDRQTPSLLVIITNDDWFGDTLAPYHHARVALLRAVESRRAVARCAGTGISLLTLPTGRVLEWAGWQKRTALVASLPLMTKLSPYHRVGDLPFVVIALLLVGWGWAHGKGQERRGIK